MSESKTKPTKASVPAFLKTLQPEQKRKDAQTLHAMFSKATGEKPIMWGTSIVGYGLYHYISTRSSQKGDWPMVGFSPRKANFSLYILAWSPTKKSNHVFPKLGKYKAGGGCLYINKLADVDVKELERMVKDAWKRKKKLVGPKRTLVL